MAFARGIPGFFRRPISECTLTYPQNYLARSILPLTEKARSLSSSRLFIGGLSWETREETLEAAFSSYGIVTEAKIITDRDTGRSRGFGFVTFSSEQDAEAALHAMDGRELGGRSIRVDFATERGSGVTGIPLRGSGGGYGAGGRGRDDGTN